jgi:hypothetical protein
VRSAGAPAGTALLQSSERRLLDRIELDVLFRRAEGGAFRASTFPSTSKSANGASTTASRLLETANAWRKNQTVKPPQTSPNFFYVLSRNRLDRRTFASARRLKTRGNHPGDSALGEFFVPPGQRLAMQIDQAVGVG